MIYTECKSTSIWMNIYTNLHSNVWSNFILILNWVDTHTHTVCMCINKIRWPNDDGACLWNFLQSEWATHDRKKRYFLLFIRFICVQSFAMVTFAIRGCSFDFFRQIFHASQVAMRKRFQFKWHTFTGNSNNCMELQRSTSIKQNKIDE